MNSVTIINELEALGSADSIAAHLLQQGIRGKRLNKDHCPIARVIAPCEDEQDFHMFNNPDTHGESDDNSIELGVHVSDFVRRFDKGEYPELEEN